MFVARFLWNFGARFCGVCYQVSVAFWRQVLWHFGARLCGICGQVSVQAPLGANVGFEGSFQRFQRFLFWKVSFKGFL